MTTFVPPQLIRPTGALTVEKVVIAPQTGATTLHDLKTDLAAGTISTTTHIAKDSGAADTNYARTNVAILDNTDGSEDGAIHTQTMLAGTLATRSTLAAGQYMAGATGGDQGSGTINATALYINGVAVTTSTGDVVGPGASTDNAVARFDLATGKLLQNSVVLVGDTGNVTGVNDLTVTGNLTVNGTTTTVNSGTVSTGDALLALANTNTTTDAVDIGLVGLYDTSGSQDLYAGLFRDATDNKWKLFRDSQQDLSSSTTVNTAATGYTVAALVANLEGNVTGVASGNVANTLYDANTIIKADSDDTPVALTMAASTILARLAAGNIVAATPTELRTLLNISNGANASSVSLTIYTDGAEFTAGTSTTLTLASTPAAEANISVYFNGVWQASTEWSFAGTTITFSAAIPSGVTAVEIRILTNA